MSVKKYTLELTEKQLRLMNRALENWFRLLLNQPREMAETMAERHYKYDKDDPDNDRKFSLYIARRNYIQNILYAAVNCMSGQGGLDPVPDDERIVQDIWSVIKHTLWINQEHPEGFWTDAYPPIKMGSEPIAICEVKEGNI